ncbi:MULTISPECIES: TonB-dependent receptor [Pseudoalteromonas]|mgnify:FL=1|uniref:TonB-dependent receptor n=4 Tax=Pseudoalteromonas TaxID=53246 RepID=UPI001600C6D3|nr:TonB-dependent receptor [Pseudoalteromonas sp. SG45-2]MBB1346690.1 TonB-dependent receptor [Pseudoalteromonas sp. SG45-2]|tara:strand:- start:1476 stop:4769 length:3294 start_codon:yes stop_codon:yes gene_type:complete
MASQKNKLFEKNKKYLWRKIKSHSSSSCVWPKTIRMECIHLPLCLPLYVLVFSLVTTEVKASSVDEKAMFNIPRQRADLSLINFAEQADITLLFPLDKIQQLQTNTITGEYSIINALQTLLDSTGLQMQVSEDGQISILIDPSFERTDNMANYKKNGVSSAVLAVLSTMTTLPALAETAAQEPEIIEVRGIRGSLGRAMDAKREAGGVVDSISAEDIGKFPDTNLAESLQRITGVSIDRSGGEGQLITVRGFGPQFNTVLVNGRQMASENQSRAFSFDTIASELVKSLDVFKTSTATMQSGGIGSTVNVNTARPFAISGFKIAGSVKGIYDENSEETTPEISGLISNTFNDDTLGLLFAVSRQERETRLNQAQVDGWLENVGVPNPQTQSGQAYTGNIFSPRNYDHKVTTETRTRTNANLVIQYAPSDDLVITADALYSDFDVEADTTSYGHWFTAPNLEGFGDAAGPTVDENGTVVDLYQEVGLATDMHAKKFDRLTNSSALGLNFDWHVNDNLNMKFDLSHSKAKREANNGGGDQLSLIGYANRVRFEVDGGILPYASEFASANPNIYSGQQELDGVAYNPAVAPDGVSNHLDTANSRAHVMLRRGWAVEDTVDQFRWDSIWHNDGSSGLVSVKFGTMYSTETKNLDRWDNEGVGIHCTFCGYPDDPSMDGLAQFVFDAGDDFLGDVSGSGRMPTSWLAHDGEANFAYLEQIAAANGQPISFDAVKRNKSFEITEDTFSFYTEFDFEAELAGMPLYATAGFRYESTDVKVKGTDEPVSALTILDKTEMLANFGAVENISASSDYEAILPNFSVKLEISDELIARAAVSQTITRPTLDSMSPVTVIETTRQGGNLTSSSGNPALEPFTSDNLDLSLEWYYADASYLSAGYFRKNVANFIINTTEDLTFELSDGGLLTDPSTGNDVDNPDAADSTAVFTNTLPNNSESAIVDGWEIALQHSFDSGFGFMVNATFVDSDAELDPADITQVFALTGLSDSYNVVGFYENGPFQARLAYNWRDSFVQSLTQLNGDGVTIVEDYAQFDASGSYDITENVSVFFEGINLTEEYVHKRGRFSNQLLMVEDSGRRFALGVRGSF